MQQPIFIIHGEGDKRKVLGAHKIEDIDKTQDTWFHISADGQIRSETSSYRTKLKTPHPILIHDDPVGTLVANYTASMEELLKKWEKIKARNEKDKKEATELVKKGKAGHLLDGFGRIIA